MTSSHLGSGGCHEFSVFQWPRPVLGCRLYPLEINSNIRSKCAPEILAGPSPSLGIILVPDPQTACFTRYPKAVHQSLPAALRKYRPISKVVGRWASRARGHSHSWPVLISPATSWMDVFGKAAGGWQAWLARTVAFAPLWRYKVRC